MTDLILFNNVRNTIKIQQNLNRKKASGPDQSNSVLRS